MKLKKIKVELKKKKRRWRSIKFSKSLSLMGAVNLVSAQSTNHSQHKSFFFLFSHSQLTNKMPCAQSGIVLPMNQSTRFWQKFFFLRLIERWVNYWRDNSENFKFDIPTKSHSHCPMSSAKNRISWAQPREESFIYRHTQKKNPHLLNTSKKRSSFFRLPQEINLPPLDTYKGMSILSWTRLREWLFFFEHI
jgi:hypothetical protein